MDSISSNNQENIDNCNKNAFPILQLPTVVRKNLLDYLPLKNILSFRLVCLETNDWVLNYPRLKQRLTMKPIEFSESTKVYSFLQLNSPLPHAAFKLKFDPLALHEREDLKQLIKKYGSAIEILSVSDMNLCLTEEENEFYSEFKSLKTLHISVVDYGGFRHMMSCLLGHSEQCEVCLGVRFQPPNQQHRVPESIQATLENLSVELSYNTFYIYDILPLFKNLKYFRDSSLYTNDDEQATRTFLLQQKIIKLTNYIKCRQISPAYSKGQLVLSLHFTPSYRNLENIHDEVIVEFLRYLKKFRLPRLTSKTLKGHDITDKVLEDVFACMSLSVLEIDEPLLQVTTGGLQRMLQGKFGQTVQELCIVTPRNPEDETQHTTDDSIFLIIHQKSTDKEITVKTIVQKDTIKYYVN